MIIMRDDQKKNLEDIEKYRKDYISCCYSVCRIEYQGDFNYAPENVNRIKKRSSFGCHRSAYHGQDGGSSQAGRKKYALTAQSIGGGQGRASQPFWRLYNNDI